MGVAWAREVAEGRPQLGRYLLWLGLPWVFAHAHVPMTLWQMHTCPVTFSGHVSLVSPAEMHCGTGEVPMPAGECSC